MDLATLLGLLGAWALVVATIVLGGSAHMFMNVPSLLIVIGGSLMVVMMKFGIGQFFSAFGTAGKVFINKLDKPEDLIDQIVELADVARKGGLLSLEGKQVGNGFLQGGIQLLVDGHDPDVVKTLLTKDMKQAVDRHEWSQKIWSAIGDVGPAMGMIGTLIGLVGMLANMDDPQSIGPAMAVALLTTLYGAMLANMLALPICDKLNLRSSEEETIKSLVIDALLAIQAGQNPRVIDTMLRTYLPGSKRGSSDEA
ncbi:MAG: flagellar motor protein PomA [Pseudohongiella sp.]|nr:MAG: flagellar motor protein PomA [Pseudohongiella sp.]